MSLVNIKLSEEDLNDLAIFMPKMPILDKAKAAVDMMQENYKALFLDMV